MYPAAPSLIATTERAERDVVALFGVPGPGSLGVVGSEGGGGTEYVSEYKVFTSYTYGL